MPIDKLADFTLDEIDTLRNWLTQMSFSGSKEELKRAFDLHDSIEFKLAQAYNAKKKLADAAQEASITKAEPTPESNHAHAH